MCNWTRAREQETPSKFACVTQMRGFPGVKKHTSSPLTAPSNVFFIDFRKEFTHLKQLIHASCPCQYSQRPFLLICLLQISQKQLEDGAVVHMRNTQPAPWQWPSSRDGSFLIQFCSEWKFSQKRCEEHT